jgi:cytochrome c
MDGWEWTKVIGAIGSAFAVLLGGFWFAGQVVKVPYPRQQGFGVEGVAPVDLATLQRRWPAGLSGAGEPDKLIGYLSRIETAILPQPPSGSDAVDMPMDLGTLLAAADAERGGRTAQVCASCHTFERGGGNRVGPNLWAVVDRPLGASSSFAYSPALLAHGGRWTYEELDEYLASPNRAIPGTRMSFAGLRNPRDRANLIAWLAAQSPDAPPFPPPAPPAETVADGGAESSAQGN